jgi:flagellar motor protein MotB
MTKFALAITALIFFILGYWLFSSPAASQSSDMIADVASGGANTALKVKVESGVTLKIATQRQRMQRMLAMPTPEAEQLNDIRQHNTALHQQVSNAKQQLQGLGEPLLAIEQWLATINWPQFLSDEQLFTARFP